MVVVQRGGRKWMEEDDELEQAQREFFQQKNGGEESGVGRFALDLDVEEQAQRAVKGDVVEREEAQLEAGRKQAGTSVWARRRQGRDGKDAKGERLKTEGMQMSVEEIQHEQEELLTRLDPAVVSKLLARASGDLPHQPALPADDGAVDGAGNGIHFPIPPRPDPDDPEFFAQLHEKYFPSLPAEPQKLSWMQPATEVENASYDPHGADFALSSLRFDFAGVLLPPQTAHEIPVSAGLHHHADAPSAAGYTVPELTLLAHSTVPSQRSLAVRTLGRVGFKVRQRVYGDILTDDLQELLANERVEELVLQLTHDHHLSVRNHAIEAAWLLHQSTPCR